MDKNMLRQALWEFLRPLIQLITNLVNPEQGETWLTELKKFLRKEPCWGKSILRIDRTKPFDPATFISAGWTIKEQDERALALTEVNLDKVCFETMLKSDEPDITGDEKLERLKKAGHIRLDAKIFQTLRENQNLIPELWKEKINGNIRCIFFDGTILRDPNGNRYVLCLCWNVDQWHWYCICLGYSFYAHNPSAVLAS